jgi:predicted P-loop ATPase
MGRQWFSDSLKTFDGKEAASEWCRAWIVEIAEMEAMNKAPSADQAIPEPV